MPSDTDVLVIGAGPAGLAAATAAKRAGRAVEVVEKAGSVGSSWRSHYERLHLHTVKSLSALPGLDFPKAAPTYVPRQGVVDYLDAYANEAGLAPRFGVEATSIVREAGGAKRWRVATRDGDAAFLASTVVVATGANRVPSRPSLPNEAAFRGRVLHSRDYRRGADFAGQRVLVVGMGNTGAEIALDLAEQGAVPTLSVRSPVQISPRDALGRPSQKTALLTSRLPPAIGDRLTRLLCRWLTGDIESLGLRRSPTSPTWDLRVLGRTPVLDIGTLAAIRAGRIAVRPGIEALTEDGARFVDGRADAFDAIVLATGYRALVEALFPAARVPLDGNGLPAVVRGEGELDGAWFIGFDTRQPGGLLRTIAMQSRRLEAALRPERVAA